ncbi:MAG: alpha/beta fold hydrolase [Deltaproteobacteria bacterium]|nr:alpha/beta fold hydrolase [Deltaproteobacteria bacterium]
MSDGFRLSGTLHLPGIHQPPVVVGSHGLLSSGSSPKQIEMARQCSENSMAFFRFDHRGCGQSEGSKADAADFNGRCRDLLSAIGFLRNLDGFNPRLGLFGSSLGGAVCLSVAAAARVDALVIVAAPLDSNSLIDSARGVVPDGLSADLALSPRFRFDLSDNLSSLSNLLIFHGENDLVVPVSHARKLFENAGHPKKLVIQENGDHVMSLPLHQKSFIQESLLWFSTILKTE